MPRGKSDMNPSIPILNRIYQGDALKTLTALPEEMAQCVVTSPPYFGLRDYGVAEQIGLEKTPNDYVAKMTRVFREVRRVLRKDGTLWLNLGDSHANPSQAGGGDPTIGNRNLGGSKQPHLGVPAGLKPKDLVGIPWRTVLALQADGWTLRSDIIWSKPNPMPESVTDRPTRAHEYIFLLSKSSRYFYDAEAIKEPATYAGPNGCGTIKTPYGQGFTRRTRVEEKERQDKQRGHGRRHAGFNERWDLMTKSEQCSLSRNKRSVWQIATQPFPEAHFATFPEDIPTLCIKAGSRQGDVVLDPFMGSGTVGVVAKRLKRNFVGIELNPAYVAMARKRIDAEPEPLLAE